MKFYSLGGCKDVGRSCLILTFDDNHSIMLDCGLHMKYNTIDQIYPQFELINHLNIDLILISHFHLDHVGALPYYIRNYKPNSKIIMTYPTKSLFPLLMDDYYKILTSSNYQQQQHDYHSYTKENIRKCIESTLTCSINETMIIYPKKINKEQDQDEEEPYYITAYYAGHVLGAVMFHIQYKSQSIVYTGDFSMTTDRHLGAAKIKALYPNILITESTYASTIRPSRISIEQKFISEILKTVLNGGNVLIPVFAFGRAQELCILIELIWNKMNLKHIPVYFTSGLSTKANKYYELYTSWTNQSIKSLHLKHKGYNSFNYQFIKLFHLSLLDQKKPMIIFATPGMLNGGISLEIFKKWCHIKKI